MNISLGSWDKDSLRPSANLQINRLLHRFVQVQIVKKQRVANESLEYNFLYDGSQIILLLIFYKQKEFSTATATCWYGIYH